MIGKHVHVTIDGKRPATEGFDEREMGTVTFSNKYVFLLKIFYQNPKCSKEIDKLLFEQKHRSLARRKRMGYRR